MKKLLCVANIILSLNLYGMDVSPRDGNDIKTPSATKEIDHMTVQNTGNGTFEIDIEYKGGETFSKTLDTLPSVIASLLKGVSNDTENCVAKFFKNENGWEIEIYNQESESITFHSIEM
ncbi:MAG: hypothetical protein LBQ08_03440 [Holosporaceae bacterium]|nr:hypothetical protein [Holosporaceae bacterium]